MCSGGFEHDEAHEIVNDAESEDLLPDVVRRFAAEDLHFHCCFEIVDVCLDRPALEVKLGDFLCWIFFVIEQSGNDRNDRSTKTLLSDAILNLAQGEDVG